MSVQFLLLLYIVRGVCSFNILAVSIFPSYSHQVVYHEVWRELAFRGHQVTSISSNPIADSSIPNLKEIDISFTYEIWNRDRRALENNKNPIDFISNDYEIFAKISRIVLALPEVQELIKSSAFDLVITEWIYPAIFGFSAVFKCPLIGINSIDLVDTLSTDIGSPVHPVVNPTFFLPFKTATTFWEKLASVKTSLWMQYFFHYSVYPTCNEIIQTYMGSGLPTVQKIIANVSLVCYNSNILFSKPKANFPNVIPFSGLHMKKAKPLPEEIQRFLDSATQGVIYFSLGSFIKSNKLSQKLKTIILDTFNELPYKVLWKFDDQDINKTLKNIKLSKWLPQQDVLAHKNIKVFITQGGLQSIEEAIRKRVPMVGMPFICDQPKNVDEMVKLQIAKFIDTSTITKETFKKIIVEVAENPRYKEKINEVANILEDEPIKSLDKVVWWIEYILRHKGAHHMQSPFVDLPWYQYFLLDIIAFILFSIVVTFFIVVRLLKVTLRLVTLMQKQKSE